MPAIKHKDLIADFSKENQLDAQLVRDCVDFFWKDVRNNLVAPDEHSVYVSGFGTFVIRLSKAKEEMVVLKKAEKKYQELKQTFLTQTILNDIRKKMEYLSVVIEKREEEIKRFREIKKEKEMNKLAKIWANKEKILEGIKNNVFKSEHVEAIAAERLRICEACPLIDKTGEKCVVSGTQPCCGACGCSLKLKTRSLSSQCEDPNGPRWNAFLTDEEQDNLYNNINYDPERPE